MDELLTPTEVAAMLTTELDWVKGSTRSDIYNGKLFNEPWRLQRAEQTPGLKADWRVRSDSVLDLISRYRSSDWALNELPPRRTNAQNEAAASSKGVRASRTAIAEKGSDIADLVRKMTSDHQRVQVSYSDALRTVGEALLALSDAIDQR